MNQIIRRFYSFSSIQLNREYPPVSLFDIDEIRNIEKLVDKFKKMIEDSEKDDIDLVQVTIRSKNGFVWQEKLYYSGSKKY